MEAAGKRHILHGSRSDEFRIWHMSDLHLMAKGCAEDRIRADVKEIAADPYSFWLGGGDYVDYIGHTDKRFDPDSVAEWVTVKQLGDLGATGKKRLLSLLGPIRGKCLGMLLGNHELRYQLQTQHESLHGWICEEMGTSNLGYCAFFDLVFLRKGGVKKPAMSVKRPAIGRNGVHAESFRVFAHHGAGYAQTPGGKLNRLIQFMQSFDADIYFCVDDKTELLTQGGWAGHNKLQPGMPIYGFQDGKVVGDIVKKVHLYDHEGAMYRIQNRSMDMLLTGDHRVLYRCCRSRNGEHGEWRFKRTADFCGHKAQVQFPCAGVLDTPGVDFADEEIAIAAWIIAEGHFHKTEPKGGNGISIFQHPKNVGHTARVHELLQSLQWSYRYTVRKDGLGRFYLPAKLGRTIAASLVGNKQLPPWVGEMNSRQFGIFLDALIDGDGSRSGNNCTFYAASESLVDDLQALAVTRGWRARKDSRVHGHSKNRNFELRLCHRPTVDHPFTKNPVTTEDYRGLVWCIETNSGAFIARRDGRVFITGNCGHVHDKVARKQPAIGANDTCTDLAERTRLGCIAGSYLKTYTKGHTGYGEQRAYAPTALGPAVVKIKPETRGMNAEV